MPSKRRTVKHLFGGGWATDFGLSADVAPTGGGDVTVPFLVEAENVYYELDGGPRKIGGASKLNSTVVNAGNEIRGLFDFWRQGTAFSPVQKRVIYSGTAIYADAADGTFASIQTGLVDDKVPCFTVFNDNLILSNDSAVDVPMTYDGTSVTNLGGTPPLFSFSCVHKNRVFAAGVATMPSHLYYSKTLDAANWTDATSGSIEIDPNDGDRITAIASYKNDLWVFKGPYKGSIHRITGSANTGSDSFARITFINGLGAVSHNTLFRFRDDIGFMWSDGTIRSLQATAAYGDFTEAALSRPIHSYLKANLNMAFLSRAWAATDPSRSLVAFTVPLGTSTFCNQVLMMDYTRQDVRWASWPAYNANCVARVMDTGTLPILMIGGRDGFVRKTNIANKAIDTSTSYQAKVTLPFSDYGNGLVMKTLTAASLKLGSSGTSSSILKWVRDTQAQQSQTFQATVGGGDLLDSTFILGTSALQGAAFQDVFKPIEDGGEFRSIQFQVLNAGLNEDMALRALGATIEIGAESLEA